MELVRSQNSRVFPTSGIDFLCRTVQFGKSLRYCGHAHAYDEVIIQGSTTIDESGSGLAFVAFYVKGDKVLAVCSLGKDPVVSHCSELLRIGKMPTATEIKSGKDVMSIPLIS